MWDINLNTIYVWLFQGLNGKVVYTLAQGDPLDQFRVDPHTGEISLKKQLDRENISSYGEAPIFRSVTSLWAVMSVGWFKVYKNVTLTMQLRQISCIYISCIHFCILFSSNKSFVPQQIQLMDAITLKYGNAVAGRHPPSPPPLFSFPSFSPPPPPLLSSAFCVLMLCKTNSISCTTLIS